MRPDEARVAVVGPFSGPRAAWGRLLVDAEAALPHAAVGWERFDDRGSAEQAAVQARAIVADGGFAAVVGHFNSRGALAALPLYRDAGLPLVLPLATDPALGPYLTDAEPGLVLRLCPDDDAQADAIVRECLARGVLHLAVAHDGSEYGRRLAERLPATGRRRGVRTVPTTWPAPPGTPAALLGQHRDVARLLLQHPPRGWPTFVGDDCDTPEFAELTREVDGEVLAARLDGGPLARVVAAFAAVAAALDKRPSRRGRALLDAVRAELPDPPPPPGAGWALEPVARPSAAPAPARAAAPDRCTVAVVGAGAVGLSTAAHLAAHGVDVAVLDAATGASASTVSGALIRAFEPDPGQRQLAVRATQLLWGRPDRAALHGFHRTGSLVLCGPEHLPQAEAGLADLAAAGARASLLDPADVVRRWPELDPAGLAGALWEPDAGYATAPVALAVLLDRVLRAGSRLVPQRARRLTGHGVELADGRTIEADAVVVAAGCSAPDLLAGRWPAGQAARTRRIRYAVVERAPHPLPCIVDLTSGMWGRPDGPDGFLVGLPGPLWDVPPQAGRGMDDAELDRIRSGAAGRLPFLAGAALLTARFGTDLYVPDPPVLQALPGPGRTVVAAGWSGGGFKTAPAAGERCADLVLSALGAPGAVPAGAARSVEHLWSV